MPAQELLVANPPADPSLLPDFIEKLKIEIDKNVLSPAELSAVQQFRRAADYIAAGQLPQVPHLPLHGHS